MRFFRTDERTRQGYVIHGPTGTMARCRGSESGNAMVEFIFLALLLMVPLIYFIVTIGQLQGASFAVAGAADQAAKVFVDSGDPVAGRVAAEQSVAIALADFGYSTERAGMEVSCNRTNCSAAGTSVTIAVRLDVSLPMVPFGNKLQLTAGRVTATATQLVGRFR